jgi:predicted O-methyltransferase YrrM
MMEKRILFLIPIILFGILIESPYSVVAQKIDNNLDEKVKNYLDKYRETWTSWNVPYEDGQILYNLIIKNNYTRALEIGTSTGHSGVWMAWALSKTGGKLITIEIDEVRHNEAVKNFEEAGVSEYVEAILGDAHTLVKNLEGPFDFVFSDADKGWYKQYFIDVDPKLVAGGCFTAHNVANAYGGVKEFLEYIKSQSTYQTIVDKSSRSGLSISYKK